MKYCVDCINFLTRVIRKGQLPAKFDKKAVRSALKRRGRVVIFWCRVTGTYYLNGHRVYELKACDNDYEKT